MAIKRVRCVKFTDSYDYSSLSIPDKITDGGARGVMVIVVGNEHGDTSSNPGRD